MHIFIFIMPISSPNPMFDHLLESSHRDDSKKWSNTGFGEEITQKWSIEVHFIHLIWSSVFNFYCQFKMQTKIGCSEQGLHCWSEKSKSHLNIIYLMFNLYICNVN